MKEAKVLLKEVGKIVDIPNTLHPESNPEDALKLGQTAGVIRIYAQNGAIWDLILADGSKKKVHQKDIAIVVCNMILEAHEKTKELPKVEPKEDPAEEPSKSEPDVDPSDVEPATDPEAEAPEEKVAEADGIEKEGIEVPADGVEREIELEGDEEAPKAEEEDPE